MPMPGASNPGGRSPAPPCENGDVRRLLGNLLFGRWARTEVAAGRGMEAAEVRNPLRRAALADAYKWLMQSQRDAVDRWKSEHGEDS